MATSMLRTPLRKPKQKRKTDYQVGPTPKDVFSLSSPEPLGPPARTLSEIERLELLIANPYLYEVAGTIFPSRMPGAPGRRPTYPPFIYLILLASISIFNTAEMACANFQHPYMWKTVREGVRQQLGNVAADELPEVGPQRHHWQDFRPKMLDALQELRQASRDAWVRQAIAQGLLERKRRGTLVRPHRSQVITGDGTVVRPASDQTDEFTIDEMTGELKRHRVDPDASIQVEGGDREIYGNKLVSFSVRNESSPHSRVILNMDTARHQSVALDPDRHEEARVALRLALEIRARAPGAHCVVYDRAWRGVHRAQLIRSGFLVYTRQYDGLKPHPLKKYRYETTGCTHDVYAATGRACERLITVEGKILYDPIPVRQVEYRLGEESRFYHLLEIPCRNGAHMERIPVYETQEDRLPDPRTKRIRFNRTEHLRIIPPGTGAGDRLSGFRQDSESGFSTLDETHRLRRIPAYGADGALLIYIGYAWAKNSVALSIDRRTR
ncbi:hypothetical protein POF50_019070 [Streptomyces sp. SL13]|uniref:Uncharacterized protein n=1 Tax=Streptantibioticus silvisoli TaxID=2705255 RepID=A0AA90K9Y3_9ACTN|nr:hypothetical protein [Streptantibioticus silvisoli]MDI5971412.1 hypothetical protein [Streptantibioticus silvisoli]